MKRILCVMVIALCVLFPIATYAEPIPWDDTKNPDGYEVVQDANDVVRITGAMVSSTSVTLEWKCSYNGPFQISYRKDGQLGRSVCELEYYGSSYKFSHLIPNVSYEFSISLFHNDKSYRSVFEATLPEAAVFSDFPLSIMSAGIGYVENNERYYPSVVSAHDISTTCTFTGQGLREWYPVIYLDTSRIKQEQCTLLMQLIDPNGFWVSSATTLNLKGAGSGSFEEVWGPCLFDHLFNHYAFMGSDPSSGSYTIKIWINDCYLGETTCKINR